MTKHLPIMLLIAALLACKKETTPIIEDQKLTAEWRGGPGISSIPYATAEGVILKSGDGIRFANRNDGEIEWYVQQNNGLFAAHQNSFVYDGVFFSLQTGGSAFKAIDIATGTELFEHWQTGMPIDNFLRLTTANRIRFSGSYLNTVAVFDLDTDGNNLDTVFKVVIPGVSSATGLDCYENSQYYFLLFLASTNGINNPTVNFCAIDKLTLDVEKHIQGLSSGYDYRLNYHFMQLNYTSESSVSAIVGTKIFRFQLNAPGYLSFYEQLTHVCDVVTHDGKAFAHRFGSLEAAFWEQEHASSIQYIPCEWNRLYSTSDANEEYFFFPLRDATVAIHQLSTGTQRLFEIDFVSSQGIHLAADTVNQTLYVTSSRNVWAVRYDQ
jgi:hypothetical protein